MTTGKYEMGTSIGYVTFSGVLESCRFIRTDGSEVAVCDVVFDGKTIPSLHIPSGIYDELTTGEHVEIYCMSPETTKKTTQKTMVVYLKKANGQTVTMDGIRSKVSALMVGKGIFLSVIVFVLAWAILIFPMIFVARIFHGSSADEIVANGLIYTTGTAVLIGGWILYSGVRDGLRFARKLGNLNDWKRVTVEDIASKYSKLYS